MITLMGPTASGKTELAVCLVQQFPLDIISVDSAMVYQGMNIGTAKPEQSILDIAPHRLIDILDPVDSYSVAQFRDDALRAIEDIHSKGRIPLLVGGTMLYHKALLQGLSVLPKADPVIREALQQRWQAQGKEDMYHYLETIDASTAKRLHPNDTQRVQRAIEVYEIMGKPLSVLIEEQQQAYYFPYHTIKLVLAPDSRAVLRERIAQRFKLMLKMGFIDEVQKLYQREDLNLQKASMKAVGYRQVWEYLAGKNDYNTMLEQGINVTRQFAKRQFTWLRKETQASWFDSEKSDTIDTVVTHLKYLL